MNSFRTLLSSAVMFISAFACSEAAAAPAIVFSPDGRLSIEFVMIGGSPGYQVHHDLKPVIRPSLLGFELKGGVTPFAECTLAETSRKSHEGEWEPVWGEKSVIRDRYNEMTLTIRGGTEGEGTDRLYLLLIFRAYDDGVAFRYELPQQPGLERYEITRELTQFRFDGDHTAWWIPGDYDSYEQLYSQTPLSEIENVNTPVTMKTESGLHISIHEAALTDYAGMTLERSPSEETSLVCRLVPWPDGVKVRGKTPMKSPWRMIQVSETAGGLIESDMILNLNEPCMIDDTSWIRPMKYVGIWWSLHIKKETWFEGERHGATTENAKRYIDFASKHGIPGLLIEGWNTGWEHWGAKGAFDYMTSYPDFDIAEVVYYAQDRGVELIGHHETGGDAEGYEELIDKAFDMYARLGIRAVKTGYAGGIFPRGQHHHGQWMVNHYRMVVEKAADYHIMIDAHEPIAPTGISRTWPNMMTREGVRGMEYNAWSEGNPPEHTTIIPFTRMLAGPADYTPGIFDLLFEQYRPDNRVHTTLAKQLALYVVLYSPLQMAADLPENYEGHPAFRFIEQVPVDWDETRVLGGEIGEYVTIARRSGSDWYIGSVTDENGRVLQYELSFLDRGRRYEATVYADTPYTNWESDPLRYEISEFFAESGDLLTLKLAPGGGQALRLVPAE